MELEDKGKNPATMIIAFAYPRARERSHEAYKVRQPNFVSTISSGRLSKRGRADLTTADGHTRHLREGGKMFMDRSPARLSPRASSACPLADNDPRDNGARESAARARNLRRRTCFMTSLPATSITLRIPELLVTP
jgi:hypothetical protein